MKTNDIPLSPVDFLNRFADVFGDSVGAISGAGRGVTYSELRRRASSVAQGLREIGLHAGDRVAVLAPNDLPLLESHFGVPAAGCTLVALNTRLSSTEYRYMLRHSQARALIVDSSLVENIASAIYDAKDLKVVVEVADESASSGVGQDYEEWLKAHDRELSLALPRDERQPISINYTSGTTGNPKGVVYSHRGAYLNAMGQALATNLTAASAYLWTLPMFHCNGWCFTWAVTAVGATHICLRRFDAEIAFEQIDKHQVTHFCGAPVLLDALADAKAKRQTDHTVRVMTGGAPPPPAVISRMSKLNINVTHLYGLTETYGPSLICEPQEGWASLDLPSLATLMARQGVRTINVHEVRVVDQDLNQVRDDGKAIGEVVIRSNTVMSGYLDDADATAAAFKGGWFHTGDLAVVHPDGYIEIRDRAKDLIISGGENISSIEVENVLASHPGVKEVAVVAVEHPKWGELPVAFISLRFGDAASEQDLIDWTRSRLAHFKAPKAVYFMDLPKTSTGKVEKTELRRLATNLRVSL